MKYPCRCKYGQQIIAQQRFATDSTCLCEQKPEDEQYLNVHPKCPVHRLPNG